MKENQQEKSGGLSDSRGEEHASRNALRLHRLRTVAHLMDDAFRVPILGIRIGLDPLLGLLPGLGDVVGATFSGWMVITAARMGAAPSTIARMLLNLGLDALFGAVPLLGDVFDIAFKANRRNLLIVQDQVVDSERVTRQSRVVVAGAVLGVVGFLVALLGFLGWLASGVWGLLPG